MPTMSAIGPKQTWASAPQMSAFGGNVLQNSLLHCERATSNPGERRDEPTLRIFVLRFSRPEASNRALSLVDFITITFESRFSVRTAGGPGLPMGNICQLVGGVDPTGNKS